MRWPWQRVPETRAAAATDYTDTIVSALVNAASGGGARTALATSALESCAALYASALALCELTGPGPVVRALGADWRASVASALIRHGVAVYLIDASPAAGLALWPVCEHDIYGGPVPPWRYRLALAGPSTPLCQ